MPSMVEIVCACGCGRKKLVREADRRRGWGKFFSKSCKAKSQARRLGVPEFVGHCEFGDLRDDLPVYSNHGQDEAIG